MKYRHMTAREDYSPYASGQVLYSLRGHPPLPVRLASEVFLRAYDLWAGSGQPSCTLYDPLCGSGATLVTLKFLHWERITSLLGSDVSPESLEIAAQNFQLLTESGLQARLAKIAADVDAYGKDSHKNALVMAQSLRGRIAGPVTTRLFHADATDPHAVQAGLGDTRADIALLDIPYGRLSAWEGALSSQETTVRVLDALATVLSPGGVVALFMPKRHKLQLAQYHRLQQIKAGKREVWLLQLG